MTAKSASAAKDSDAKPLLGEEISFYESKRDELIRDHINRHLLIKGSELIGSFETRDQAIAEGCLRFGRGPFLVRLTGEDTPVVSVPAISAEIPLSSGDKGKSDNLRNVPKAQARSANGRGKTQMTSQSESAGKDSGAYRLLGEEMRFYESKRDELIRDHINRHLLIKGSELIGSFETRDQAIAEGCLRFGRGPFLVRLTGEETPVEFVPSVSLGIPLCR